MFFFIFSVLSTVIYNISSSVYYALAFNLQTSFFSKNKIPFTYIFGYQRLLSFMVDWNWTAVLLHIYFILYI